MVLKRFDRSRESDTEGADLRTQFENFVAQARPAGGATPVEGGASSAPRPRTGGELEWPQAELRELRRELVAARAEAAAANRELMAVRAVNEHLTDRLESARLDLESVAGRLVATANAPIPSLDVLA